MANQLTTAERFRRRLRRISEVSILELKEHQFFQPPELLESSHILGKYTPMLDRTTAIGSMGSCFAREIKSYLESNNYNYIHHGDGARASHGSAAWERVYNTACIHQEVERALAGKRRIESYSRDTDGRIYDLFRKSTAFESLDEAGIEEEQYIECAERAFLDSDIFIFTLGLSEVWRDKTSGLVLAEAPPASVYDPKLHAFGLLSPQENIDNIRSALDILFARRPDIKIIVTVSPVPLRATFFDRSAAISNNVSKANLIYTAHEINQSYDNVWYFPSFEISQYLTNNAFGWDGRHVTEETVQLIMSLFMQTFEHPK